VDDDELIGTDIFWSASKNRSYRTLIKKVFRTLIDFLQSNGLTTKTLLKEGVDVDEKFVINRSDLTEEGFEFYQRVEQRWFNAIDNGAKPTDTALLERALQEIRRRT
jgi:hypothetical protein